MSCAFTAPQVSVEQWKKEIANMTNEAREVRDRDVFGLSGRNTRNDDDDDDDQQQQHEQQKPDSSQQQEQETEEFINDKIQKFDNEIHKLSEKETIDLAQFSCSEYANSRNFKLMFLHAETYDEKLAAKRMLHYWNDKVYFFGMEKAFHKITLADLEEDDQVALNGGGLKILDDKDASGRTILIWDRSLLDNRPGKEKNNGRYVWYVMHALLEDESAQKNGVVIIVPPIRQQGINRIVVRSMARALPYKMVAMHFMPLMVVTWNKMIYGQLLWIVGELIRLRIIQHKPCSTEQETINDWASYGISFKKLIRKLGGDTLYDYQAWLEKRRALELSEEQNGEE